MKIVEYAKAHPWATGIVVVIGGIIFIMIVRGGGGGEAETSGGSGGIYRPSEAEISANAAVQVANIQNAGMVAQAGAATQAANIGAGVQMNSDNKAAEIAMRQIEAAKELGLAEFSQSANYETARYSAVMGALPKLKKKNRDDVIKSLVTGEYGYAGRPSSTIERIGNASGQVANAAKTFASIFSDQRLKENIVYKGDDAQGRKVFEYNYKGSDNRRLGYIAQDLEVSAPDMVRINQGNGFLMIEG